HERHLVKPNKTFCLLMFEQSNKQSAPCKNVDKTHLSRCNEKCPVDCVDEHYDISSAGVTNNELSDDTEIFMYRKPSADVIYIHSAKMNLIELFSNIGGLGSLWLGATVLMFFDVTQNLLVKILRRYKL